MSRKNQFKTFQISSNTNAESKLAYIDIIVEYSLKHGINFEARTITIADEINSELFSKVDAAITLMESGSLATITLKIFSHGGDTCAAMAIAARMRKSKCSFITEGYGQIMSAATLLLASGDKRKIDRNAQFMWHEGSSDLESLKVSEIVNMADQLKKEELTWANEMGKLTKKPAKFWKECGVGVDRYFTAEELVKYGVVDEIF